MNYSGRKSLYFISKNSLWFYLWHIIPTTIIGLYKSEIYLFDKSFIVRIVFIILVATTLTYIQNKILEKIKSKTTTVGNSKET